MPRRTQPNAEAETPRRPTNRKLLLWIALILLVIRLIGFFVRSAEGARWYRW
jgi:hypothetical protein